MLMRLQRVGHDLATEPQQQSPSYCSSYFSCNRMHSFGLAVLKSFKPEVPNPRAIDWYWFIAY